MATPSTGPGYVYILKPNVLVGGKEVIKIGMTTRSVRERVRELQTGSVMALELAYSIHVDAARGFEQLLHQRFEANRLTGEFFSVPAAQVIAEIEEIATLISRERAREVRDKEVKAAQEARDKELTAYCKAIGARKVEFRLGFALGCLTFACWFLLVVLIYRSANFVATPAAAVTITSVAGFFLIGLTPILTKPLGKLFRKLIYEDTFGPAIEAKHAELRFKYPLAYT
jgi:hypothetical protein